MFSNKAFPKGGDGGGGSAIWEKFPNNPVIFFDSVPNAIKDKEVEPSRKGRRALNPSFHSENRKYSQQFHIIFEHF